MTDQARVLVALKSPTGNKAARQVQRRLFALALVVALLLGASSTVLAGPPVLPSSFWGTVKVDGENAPDGTVVRALIDGQVYAEEYTQTYEGESFYALNVRADDTDTPASDGGREGDTIQFEVGGVLVEQTGIWHGGTNVRVDLTVSAAGPPPAPPVTPSPAPTQTPTAPAQPSPTPTAVGPSPPTPTVPAQPSPTPTTPAQSSPTPAAPGQPSPSPTRVLPTNPGKDNPGNAGLIVVLVVVVVVVAAVAVGGAAWAVRRRR